MTDHCLAERFESERPKLQTVAYRLLGSWNEAEDVLQEAWLRLGRTDPASVNNLGGWLRTVVTRICLDVLRTRRTHGDRTADPGLLDQAPDRSAGAAPEEQALVADSVSRALLIVLDRLEPAERIAFVLHDMFGVPFAQIAPIVDRSPATTKKLASRARHKVQGEPVVPAAELGRQRRVVAAFLAAARAGDLPAVLEVLDPDVVRRVDSVLAGPGVAEVLRGARAVAEGTVALAARSRLAEAVLVNGAPGLVIAQRSELVLAVTFSIVDDRIVAYQVTADPATLRQLTIAVLPDTANDSGHQTPRGGLGSSGFSGER